MTSHGDTALARNGSSVRRATADDAEAMRRIWLACVHEGAWEGIDEAAVDGYARAVAADPSGTLVAIDRTARDAPVIGVLAPDENLLAVSPGHRRRGHGRALVAAGLDLAREGGDPYLLLYVPGGGEPARDTPGRRFAEALGFEYRATLTRMRLDGLMSVPRPVFPPTIVVTTYDPARDDVARYVAMINAAFAEHPTPARWDVAAVARAHARPDFDAAGIAIVALVDDPGTPVGFVRTSVADGEAGLRFGEVRLIGVLPRLRGIGVGRALLRWSLARFRDLGLDRAELSVVVANAGALTLYRAEGFRTIVAWPQWSLGCDAVGSAAADPTIPTRRPPARDPAT